MTSFLARAAHALGKPFRRRRYKQLKASLEQIGDGETIFSEIYRHNLWNDAESKSGAGSTLAYTASIRAALERLLPAHGVQTFLDAPCGDFHWMQHVKLPDGARYFGGDIVPALAADMQLKYGNATRSFVHLDITRGPLPAADLWMCRDCWFHLSFADIARALQAFAQSEIPRVLLTTHIVEPGKPFANRDIHTGDARPIDLRADPFGFPEPIERFDDWIPPFAPREMGLWTRDQVLPVAARMAQRFL